MIETPIENAQSVIGVIEIPDFARPYCDIWGNFNIEPFKTIEEIHGSNFIKVFIFKIDKQFFYGYQLKIDKVVRQKTANINDSSYGTEAAARIAARNELTGLTSEAKLRRVFITFDKICYNQPELF
jgi:hypothetical protein